MAKAAVKATAKKVVKKKDPDMVRNTLGTKSAQNRGRIFLSYDLRDPEQRAFCEWASTQKNLSGLILDMWRGMVTEVTTLHEVPADELEKFINSAVKEAMKNAIEENGLRAANTAETLDSDGFDEDAFEAMMNM